MPIKFLNCNRANVRPSLFRPYDLDVIHDDKKLNDEYFTVSNKGVVQMYNSKSRLLKMRSKGKPVPTEFLQLHEWMSQSTMFNVLTSMKFFKH
jgi:dynein heavy chain